MLQILKEEIRFVPLLIYVMIKIMPKIRIIFGIRFSVKLHFGLLKLEYLRSDFVG